MTESRSAERGETGEDHFAPRAPGALSRLRADVVEMVREQREFVELRRALVRRDLMLRYRNAVMGFGWAVFMPLLQMLVFTLVFTRVAPLDMGMPYPVYAYAGLLAWTFTSSSLRAAALSLTSNPNLITKIHFPREVLPFAAVLVALFDFAIASVVLVVLIVHYDIAVGWTVAFLPVVVLVHVAFTTGIALLISMAYLFYADVKYILELVLIVWMFASSVLYPVDRVGGVLGTVMQLNPMTPIIEAYRDVILRHVLPDPGPFSLVAAFSLVVLAGGWLTFHRAEFRFAEEI
jgi:ABC-2 type transport system permease protein/lipopolysaccharide transport system permease protein